MNYDGSGKLGEALAALCGFSPKNQNAVAARIKEAKDGLGITARASDMPPSVKLSIWQWHYERMNHTNTVEDISQSECKVVEDNSQVGIETVEHISQADSEPVEDISQHYPDDKLIRLAFYTNTNGLRTRQVVALHGFMLNALMAAIGATDKADVPKWLNVQADRIDGGKSITWQVQRLIVHALINTSGKAAYGKTSEAIER